MRYDIDSCDIDFVCEKRGLDQRTADLKDIEAAVRDEFGNPMPVVWF